MRGWPRRWRPAKPALVIALAFLSPSFIAAAEWNDGLSVFLEESCVGCHAADTDTRLDLTSLGYDLENQKVFRAWVNVFDRVERGEMPPASEPRPSEESRRSTLATLRTELTRVNRRHQQEIGRVPSRRLSRSEYEHTLHDLLVIGGNIAKHLPPESESEGFDVVATTQEMSSVHVRSLLKAADLALDEAIQLGKKPMMSREIDYFHSPYIQMWVDRPVRRGGGTVFKTNQDVVTFRGENYVFRSDLSGFRPSVAGRYRVRIKAAAHQPRSSITLSLKRQNDKQGDSALIAAWDLVDETNFREVETTTYLRPDDIIYVSADELEPAPDGRVIYNGQPASSFGGEGVKIRKVTVEGPLEDSWPPQRTQNLFPGIEWKPKGEVSRSLPNGQVYEPLLAESGEDAVRTVVLSLASKAYRKIIGKDEIDELVALAKPSLQSDRDVVQAARIPLRAILISPQLLYLSGGPGQLSDRDLASRMSYFLWRSIPDDELTRLAEEGVLSDPMTLRAQVDRMLDDPKFERFVQSFLNQWLDLDQIDATTPDVYLYPEYDDVLRQSMLAETRQFFAHLIDANLGVANLIESDFAFLNRRLAEHYGIPGVEGEHIRKVELSPDSVRGGILAHASIAKVTANGTTTSPVRRGNFILTNLLGVPTSPPPPNVGSIEPDTRGATTIRETLQKHQEIETCAACHRRIDPPGFAMECFDPVGSFRERYRNSKGVQRELNAGLRFLHKDYDLGLPVDASGVMEDGFRFEDFWEFKQHLRASQEQLARNLVSKLVVFSTGGEIEFADREEIERILASTSEDGYPLRDLIHHVISSRMFRHR